MGQSKREVPPGQTVYFRLPGRGFGFSRQLWGKGEPLVRRSIPVLLLSVLAFLLAACSGKPAETQPQTSSSPKVESYFTMKGGKPPEIALKEAINGAKSTLDVAVFQLSKEDITTAIIDAHKRGVVVRVISDRSEYEAGTNAAQFTRLHQAGVPLKINTHRGKMHLKLSISDQELVTTGSFNYTVSAVTRNNEVLLLIRDPEMARSWTAEFERLWNDTVSFKEFTPTR